MTTVDGANATAGDFDCGCGVVGASAGGAAANDAFVALAAGTRADLRTAAARQSCVPGTALSGIQHYKG
jgi:hypothetical protein